MNMIKSIVIALSLTALTLPNVFAQSTGEAQSNSAVYAPHQITRAEVRHELEELEEAGYSPAQGDDSSYPADLQAAEERVAAKHRMERDAMMSAGQNAQMKPTP
jgi:hypothetical protein